MRGYHIELCGVKRELPYVDINDTLAYAAFITIGDTEMVCACAKELAARVGEVDVVITAEAKGIPWGFEVSRILGHKGSVVIRKSVKTYMSDVIEEDVNSITTQGTQKMYLEGSEAKKLAGKRVCIVDDVISTGESLRAIEAIVEKAGGTVVARAAALAEGDAADREDIIFLQKLPLFTKTETGYVALD